MNMMEAIERAESRRREVAAIIEKLVERHRELKKFYAQPNGRYGQDIEIGGLLDKLEKLNPRTHVLGCNEYHEHRAPECCQPTCWCQPAVKRCPTCTSPAPHLHPAVQHEGEVQPCRDPWHKTGERPQCCYVHWKRGVGSCAAVSIPEGSD